VTLARPVPKDGQGRVAIVKTYKDAKSYYMDGNRSGNVPTLCSRAPFTDITAAAPKGIFE
jgi:hypothetical protein